MKKSNVVKMIGCALFALLMIAEINIVQQSGSFAIDGISIVSADAEGFGGGLGGDLGCEDLSNCDGKASCGEAGTVNGCTLNCESGTFVSCRTNDDDVLQ